MPPLKRSQIRALEAMRHWPESGVAYVPSDAEAALYAYEKLTGNPMTFDPMTLQHWPQKDGTVVDVANMDDEHIDRTIKMLCRALEKGEEKTPAYKKTHPRTRDWLMRNNRAWIERLTFELAERALGKREWKPILSYILARRIFDRAGKDPDA